MTTQLIISLFVGMSAGYLGSFMVLRRMALVGDALSHVALPGIALAIMWGINPFLGAFVSLLIGIILIWLIQQHTRLNIDALVGLIFTGALAVGLLITPHEEILDALIGDINSVTRLDIWLAVILSLIIVVSMARIRKQFILDSLSPELAQTSGVKRARINFIFLFLVTLIVALGIKVVGTLLMGALVIIPAIAARNVTRSMSGYVYTSALIGGTSGVAGVLLAHSLSLPAGPLVVLVSAVIFLISLAFIAKS